MTEEGNGTHSWLGRLYSSLVRIDGETDDTHEAAPEVSTEEDDAVRTTSTLDIQALRIRLVQATEPVASLKELVSDIRSRETAAGADGPLPPGTLELYLAQKLEEAGLLATDLELPRFRVIVPHTSGMFYLHVDDAEVLYLAELRVFGIEAALNAVLLADAYLVDAGSATEEDLVGLESRIASSIVAQVPTIEGGTLAQEENPDGEWAVRKGISTGIECARLPYRLSADFRVNVAGGDVAFQVALTPPELFGARAFVGGVGVVPSTTDMRRRAATDYNLRLGVLLAAIAFRCSPAIRRVWVVGTVDTPSAHACFYGVTLERADVDRACSEGFDPIELMRSCDAVLDEHDGFLEAVRQPFGIEEERFCPRARYQTVELSSHTLSGATATALGATRVSDLSVAEERQREAVSSRIMRRLSSSTEANVRMILEEAEGDQDPSVQEAAKRVVGILIEGTLSDDDPMAVVAAFVRGDPLSKALPRAKRMLMGNAADDAERLLMSLIGPLQAKHAYEDTDEVEWRSFDNYVDRVIYNRLLATKASTCLAPSSYVEALEVAAVSEVARGDAERSLPLAEEAVRIAPLDINTCLCLSRSLELTGDVEGALDAVRELLRFAHDPQTIGLAYYHLAELEWRLGKIDAAQACYLRALRFLPQALAIIGTELQALLIHEGVTGVAEPSYEQLRATLSANGIPMAPTDEVSAVFFDAMRAATDAEIFPVAKNFMAILGSIAHDDVYYGMYRSIEDEPDR